VRTFSVVPLTEECGLIEWVPHLTGLRIVLQEQYKRAGIFSDRSNTMIKDTWEAGTRDRAPPADTLRRVLKLFPPIFNRYFTRDWPEPAAWFRARSAFAHTAAVWSMVGHIVGLGDRHGENILVDGRTGDCVHVDFSCLFDKGLELEKPEMVPFRLTQNMVDALGVAGTEGAFCSVCEVSLAVLRTHRDALMSVLETFVHDPLLEWTKVDRRAVVAPVAEAQARSGEALQRIRSRLEGVVVGVGAAPSLPLSAAGQARRLIEEAVNLDNLGRMVRLPAARRRALTLARQYIWWMPFW
jgi:serine/threonine-protein kinase ATR